MNRKEKTNLDSRIDYGVILPVFLFITNWYAIALRSALQ